MGDYPGSGTLPCSGFHKDGSPCGSREVEGLEYCLFHVPDDLLDEAEDITGVRRCRDGFGEPGACRRAAVKATDPPRCRWHSSRRGRKDAALAVVEGRVAEAAAVVSSMADLDSPPPIGNPLSEMMDDIARMGEWERMARRVVGQLDSWRYSSKSVGEQQRAELLLWERALDRKFAAEATIARLNIAQQLVGIRAETAAMVARALTEALQQSGADLGVQDKARKALSRSLKVIDGELAG
jgi:hypothetical protein